MKALTHELTARACVRFWIIDVNAYQGFDTGWILLRVDGYEMMLLSR